MAAILSYLLALPLAVLLLCSTALAHVALTYPPARRYDLDFLDNSRTKGPCGMPKGNIRTTLLSGSNFNISWHLAYPHRGGFKLQVLDSLERPVLDLTPVTADSDFVKTDATAQSFSAQLPPEFTCEDCTVRLLRQASEWGSSYRFWSCADVDIKPKKDFKEDCSGHGKYLLSKCRCDRLYYGPRCQYRDECIEHGDCGDRGKCIDVQATTAPRKQCYCELGWFGPACTKRSPVRSTDIDFGIYSRRDLSDKFRLFWRILKEEQELEVVMVVNGTSYAGLGWRPRTLTPACRNFPEILERGQKPGAYDTAAVHEPIAEHGAHPEPEGEPSAHPEPKAEPGAHPEPEPNPEPGAHPEPEPKSEPEAEPSSHPEPKAEPTAHPEPAAEPAAEPTAEPESKPEPEPSSTTAKPSFRRQFRPKSVAARAAHEVQEAQQSSAISSVTYSVSASRGRRAVGNGNSSKSAEPEPEPKSEPEPSKSDEPHAEPNAEPEPKPEPEGTSKHGEPKAEPEPGKSPKSGEPNAEPEPKPEPEKTPKSGEPNAEPEPKPEPEKTAKSGEPNAEPEPKPEPEKTPKSGEPNAEPEPEPEPEKTLNSEEPNAEPEPKPEPEGPSKTADPNAEPEPKPEPEKAPKSGEPASEPEPKPEPEKSPKSGEPSAESEPHPEPGKSGKSGEPNAEPEPRKGKPTGGKNYVLHPYTPRHDFNPMDCTDLVIGMARGTASRIWDYYTRDRSTPRLDTFWGGNNDLTAAMGFEKNGVTTILFRKKLIATEPTDHSVVQDLMHVIWARGQEAGDYNHSPKSGLEKEAASVKDFYRADELKYHGHGSQRGVVALNFFDETKPTAPPLAEDEARYCGSSWRTPSNCDPAKNNCEYYAKWEYLSQNDEVRFTIQTTHTETWTGIAFSDDQKMSNTDAILGLVEKGGRPFFMDTWINGYNAPITDEQSIYNETGRVQDGVTTLTFVRKRQTGDPKDIQFTDDHCVFFQFPVHGGPFHSVNKRIKKHAQIPVVSPERICIRPCDFENEVVPTPPTPPKLRYNVAVKLVNLAQNFEPPKRGSEDFETLSNQIASSFQNVLKSVPGFKKLAVSEFSKNDGNLVAKMNLVLDKAMYEKGRALKEDPRTVRKAIEDTVRSGKVGALTLDPNYLEFEPMALTSSEPIHEASSFWLSWTKLYVVIGCIAALVLIAIIQAGCTIYKTTRSTGVGHKEQLVPNSAWKDYSAASTNYAFDAFESEEKPNGIPMSTRPGPPKVPPPKVPGDSRSLQRPRHMPLSAPPDRSTYSLPRTAQAQPSQFSAGYYTHRPQSDLQPDFYFMPSQRKYSGEVVRVYVDYSNNPKK